MPSRHSWCTKSRAVQLTVLSDCTGNPEWNLANCLEDSQRGTLEEHVGKCSCLLYSHGSTGGCPQDSSRGWCGPSKGERSQGSRCWHGLEVQNIQAFTFIALENATPKKGAVLRNKLATVWSYHESSRNRNPTTCVLTAGILIGAIRAGITAAAGHRFAIQLICREEI